MAAVLRFRADALVRVLARADVRLRALAELVRELAELRRLAVPRVLAVLRLRPDDTERVDTLAFVLLRQLARRARAVLRRAPDFRANARPRLTPQPTER